MSRVVRVQSAATSDLDQFAAYIAGDSVETAIRFLDAAQLTFEFLADCPFAGVPCRSFFRDKRAQELRLWRVKGFPKHQVLYRVDATTILIVRVIHASRDKETVLDED